MGWSPFKNVQLYSQGTRVNKQLKIDKIKHKQIKKQVAHGSMLAMDKIRACNVEK